MEIEKKREMTTNIRAVSQIIDKKTRDDLKCINFTGKEVVATDGYIVARCKCNVAPGIRVVEPYKNMKSSDYVDDDGSIQGKAGKLEVAPVQMTYPPYEKIYAQTANNKHLRIGLSVDILQTVVKMMKKMKKSYIVLNFAANELDPVKGVIGDVELALMPFFVREET